MKEIMKILIKGKVISGLPFDVYNDKVTTQ